MEGFTREDAEKGGKEEIFSKSIKAGKRTYFFDVKATRKNDYFLTITESKKRFNEDGTFQFEKHKIFLYKEDFEKFTEGLNEVLDYIKANQTELTDTESYESELETASYSNVDFEDIR